MTGLDRKVIAVMWVLLVPVIAFAVLVTMRSATGGTPGYEDERYQDPSGVPYCLVEDDGLRPCLEAQTGIVRTERGGEDGRMSIAECVRSGGCEVTEVDPDAPWPGCDETFEGDEESMYPCIDSDVEPMTDSTGTMHDACGIILTPPDGVEVMLCTDGFFE